LKKLFPDLGDVAFEAEWYGKIGMTADNLPRFHRLAENVIGFSGYNGRGIAPGTVFGRTLAQLISGEIARWTCRCRSAIPRRSPSAPHAKAITNSAPRSPISRVHGFRRPRRKPAFITGTPRPSHLRRHSWARPENPCCGYGVDGRVRPDHDEREERVFGSQSGARPKPGVLFNVCPAGAAGTP
jgi:hypothetical protein